ncbi:MAG: hypothetical protein QOI85_697 [Chloroflexota bacterium]|nr:hypothetical protein [Chloroflexota bacterium]
MDDLRDRYARLVGAFGAEDRDAAGLDRIAADAEALAATAESTWLRVQAGALAEAARAAAGAEPDLETIVDASPPPNDETARARLDAVLPAGELLVDRLAAHEDEMRLPSDALASAAQGLLDVLRRRAMEDLDLPDDHGLELQIVTEAGAPAPATLDTSSLPVRLVLDAGVPWTAERLLRAIGEHGYPGRHLARLMRPRSAEWSPSPETTVEVGLAAVGVEVLLADHELAHELARIGRAAGASWDGSRIVAVRHALDDLAPGYATAAIGARADVPRRLAALGADLQTADALVQEWRDPLARAAVLARAAGPPLVRAWLAAIGQTTGLQRLLTERLVPTMLRAELPDVPA